VTCHQPAVRHPKASSTNSTWNAIARRDSHRLRTSGLYVTATQSRAAVPYTRTMSASVADPAVRAVRARIILSVVGALLASLLIITGVLALLGGGTSGQPRSNLVGEPVSAFTILPGVNGGAVRAPWLSHHSAVLLFFADWCAPCHAELPALSRSLGSGRIGDTVVIGIDGDHSPSVALSFVTASGTKFAVAQDANLALASTLVPAFPAAVFVTSRGIVASEHFGVITVAQLRAGVAALG
jgi:peroxiredoxin